MVTVCGRRLQVFRATQASNRVQRARLQGIRFAGCRHVRGRVREMYVPAAARVPERAPRSDRGGREPPTMAATIVAIGIGVGSTAVVGSEAATGRRPPPAEGDRATT
jgi:hypothetical protein